MKPIPEPPEATSVVAYVCSVTGCAEIATVMVERDPHAEAPFCGEHWQAARKLADHRLSAIMVLPRPHCFVSACATPALEIVVHVDGALVPCCERHLEDLSWVTPELSRGEVGHV